MTKKYKIRFFKGWWSVIACLSNGKTKTIIRVKTKEEAEYIMNEL